jgi:DNA-binding transcriptional MerR regulator
MRKSAEAFRTISEVAEELDVQKHVLRFWEVKFPQIKPLKRGGGRRYYRPADVELLRGIRALLHNDGYTIKGVQKLLREEGVEFVKQRVDGAMPVPATPPQANRKTRPTRTVPAGRARRETGLSDSQASVLSKAIAELKQCRAMLTRKSAQEAAKAELPSAIAS